METIEGTVSHLQNTVSVTGGGNNSRAATTYIALFRLDGRPVQFRCPRPIPFADGDRLKAAGRARTADLLAYACRDLTTGSVLNSGVWRNVFGALGVLLFGLFFSGFLAGHFGRSACWVYLPFILWAVWLIVRAALNSSAQSLVQAG